MRRYGHRTWSEGGRRRRDRQSGNRDRRGARARTRRRRDRRRRATTDGVDVPQGDVHGRRHHHRRLPPDRAGCRRGDPPVVAVPAHAPSGGDLGEQCARRDLGLRGGGRGEGSRADLLVVGRGLFARKLDGSRHRGLAHTRVAGCRLSPREVLSGTFSRHPRTAGTGDARRADASLLHLQARIGDLAATPVRRPPCSRGTCCAADCSP